MASRAAKRLSTEIRALRQEECPEFTVDVCDDSILTWQVVLFGPRDSVYAGGHFEVNAIQV